MIRINKKEDCCGCTACASICPHGAITMQPDAMGFLYPVVDETACVECGLCERVCAFNDNYDKSLNLRPIAFAARHKSMDEVMKSRSGAAFVAISDYVLEHGGVVYGAGYKDHFRVAHKRATDKTQRDEFRGSKYVQSDLRGVFVQVKQDLKDGLTVLFSGTPCQTSGLNSFVGKRLRENLILVDIVCHGVPSPYIWRDYLEWIEKQKNDTLTVVNFRDKEKYGWKAHHETFEFENGGGKNSFTYLFYRHIMFRHSCGNCHFTNLNRPSDITLADFWGWEKAVPGMNEDDKGLSLVLINTEKGHKVFDAVKDKLNIKEVPIEKCLQPNLVHSSKINPKRELFEKEYVENGFNYVWEKYCKIGFKDKYYYPIRYGITHRIKKILGKI